MTFADLLERSRRMRPVDAAKLFVTLVVAWVSLKITAHVFTLFNDPFLHGKVDFDESHFVWGGWCMTKGLVPYRDFLEFKPPFVFFTHFVAMKIYGYRELAYRNWFALFPLTSLLSLQIAMMSRGISKVLTLAFVIAVVQLWVNPVWHDVALSDTESIGLAYYFLAVAFLIVKTPWRDYTNAIGGAFLVMCVLSKEPYLPVAGLTWISTFLMGDRTDDVRVDAKRYARWTGLGGLLVVVGVCAYMVPTGSMKEYISMMSRYPRFYRDPQQSYCVVLGRFYPTTRLNDLLNQYHNARREFLNLTSLGYVLPLGLAGLFFTARRSWLLLTTTLLGCFFALLAVTASNCQWMHYYNMTMSGLFFFMLVGLDSMRLQFRSIDPFTRGFLRFVIAAAVLLHVWPRIESEEDLFGTRKTPNEYPDPFPGVLAAISRYTVPTDRIFTTGPPSLYPETDRISAVRESAIVDEALGYYDGDTDEQKLSGLRAQLEKNRPKVVITDPWVSARRVRTSAALVTPFLQANHYQQVEPNIWLRPD